MIQNTKVIVQDGKCQLTSVEEDIDVQDIQTRGEQLWKSVGVINEDQQKVVHAAKLHVKDAEEHDKVNMTASMQKICQSKDIEKIEVKKVDETTFSKMKNGEFVDRSVIDKKTLSKVKRDDSCSSIKVSTTYF